MKKGDKTVCIDVSPGVFGYPWGLEKGEIYTVEKTGITTNSGIAIVLREIKAPNINNQNIEGRYLERRFVKGEKNFGTVLKTVFLNGEIAPAARNITLAQVRENANR